MNCIKTIILLTTFIIPVLLCNGQLNIKKEKWNNRDKGTFVITRSYMPVVPADNPENVGISIKMYELKHDGCVPIEGQVIINRKSYFVYDSTWLIDEDGEREIWNYFHTTTPEGAYEILANAGGDYYPIRTAKLKLEKSNSYRFIFYFVRKDALKRQ